MECVWQERKFILKDVGKGEGGGGNMKINLCRWSRGKEKEGDDARKGVIT